MDPRQLYKEGRLEEAIAALNDIVRSKPADIESRGFLAEVLCVVGKLDRADAQLEIVLRQEPKSAVTVSLLRQLIRAERSRAETMHDGRAPEMLINPTDSIRLRLEALLAIREGKEAEAAGKLAQAEELRAPLTGTMNGAGFSDFRDLDDTLGDVMEVLTSTGKYFWIPMNTIESMKVRPPERPIDLLWLPVEMTVSGGPDGVVYIPSIYATDRELSDPQLQLGRATDWRELEGGAMRGLGLRSFLLGDESVTQLQLSEIQFGS